jgi:hypothetical protein
VDLLPSIAQQLSAALTRVLPYSNLLPPTVVEDAREAVAGYEAYKQIVQRPGTHNEEAK